jgi:hypothetical protein
MCTNMVTVRDILRRVLARLRAPRRPIAMIYAQPWERKD